MAGNINTLDSIVFSSAAAAVQNQVVTRGFKLIDATYNVLGGVATNSNFRRSTAAAPAAFSDATTAISTGAANTIVYTVDVIPANNTFSTGDTIQYQPTGANTLNAVATVIPTTWIAG